MFYKRYKFKKMRKIIHHLRRQPEHVRRNVLHVATLGFGAILVVLWVFSLGRNLTSSETKSQLSDDLKPLSSLKANIIDGYYSLSEPFVEEE